MNIKKGDKVKFINEAGGGTVTGIIDLNTVKVLTDTGFEIPYLTEELMPDYSSGMYDSITETEMPGNTVKEEEEEPVYTGSPETNLYLAFLPENHSKPDASDLELYIINDSDYFVFYNVITKGDIKHKSVFGKTEPNIKEKINIFDINLLPDNFMITVQIIFFDKKEFDVLKPVHKEISIKSFKFYKKGTYKGNDFFDKNAYVIPVFESGKFDEVFIEEIKNTDFGKVKKQKEKQDKTGKTQKKEQKYLKEVDLHIHELLDDESGMSDYDKLQYQLDVFHKEMKSAVKEGYKRIVFIHGVGSGSLKLKIRNELQHKYKQYKFQDASFREYGYGATMVLLRK